MPLDTYKRATTAAATRRNSTNELLLSTASSKVPSIFTTKSTDITSTSPTIYPSQILSPLCAPSTTPSVFSSILPPGNPFETPPG